MNARESPNAFFLLLQPVLHQIIQIPEAPGNWAQASNVEQCIEDLRVDLEPFLCGAVDVAASGVAHGGRGADEH
jgi:hypothetical protein